MLKIHKNIIFDNKQIPIAVQIPIDEFNHIEEVIENYGLAKLIEEAQDDEKLSLGDAKKYYQLLKSNVEN
ncbi:MAG: hypothetical protein ACUZ8O_17100 [Candidatus Anammoxibacter sp.]